MKHIAFNKKFVILAAAVVLVLGTGTFAAGKIASYTASSSSTPTYTVVPSDKEMSRVYGFVPTVLDNFSNGYRFDSITTVNASANDDDNKKVKSFKEADITYKKGNETIDVYTSTEKADGGNETPIGTYKGIAIGYVDYVAKTVPSDYQMTEQDKADEAAGLVFFGCDGSDEVSTQHVQGWNFYKDGIEYSACAMDSSLTQEEMVAMAKEIIDAQ